LIQENSLGNYVVTYHGKGEGIVSFFSALLKMIQATEMTVDKLIRGTIFACKDVTELLKIEDETREATINLQTLLEVTKTFGNQEVIDVDADFKSSIQKNPTVNESLKMQNSYLNEVWGKKKLGSK
tara:strand:+ start:2749 stop:3126 length:378 start_codon:yes stop_codon:yes gene_type:complete